MIISFLHEFSWIIHKFFSWINLLYNNNLWLNSWIIHARIFTGYSRVYQKIKLTRIIRSPHNLFTKFTANSREFAFTKTIATGLFSNICINSAFRGHGLDGRFLWSEGGLEGGLHRRPRDGTKNFSRWGFVGYDYWWKFFSLFGFFFVSLQPQTTKHL